MQEVVNITFDSFIFSKYTSRGKNAVRRLEILEVFGEFIYTLIKNLINAEKTEIWRFPDLSILSGAHIIKKGSLANDVLYHGFVFRWFYFCCNFCQW